LNASSSLVALQQISHTFGNQKVLDDISANLTEKRICAILGKSGSGKSTLLRVINGMIRPDFGQVWFSGKPLDYENIFLLRLKIGYVVQQVGLFPHMTVQENIELLGKIAHKPVQEVNTRIKVLMDMVGLPTSYLSKYPHQLSGGEQQRVGLCRAMLLQPPLLLMDEPFASLDYATKQAIYQHLLDIQDQESRTIALVTHDWEEAIRLADDFIWMAQGRIKASGDKTKLVEMKNTYLKTL